jgi:hypothetical protein
MDPIGESDEVLVALIMFMLVLPLGAYAPKAGEPAPDFSVITVGGTELSYYNDIRGEKPAYLIFWSTCPIAKETFPVWRRHGGH